MVRVFAGKRRHLAAQGRRRDDSPARLTDAERKQIAALYRSGMRQTDTARQLGWDKRHVWHVLRRFRLVRQWTNGRQRWSIVRRCSSGTNASLIIASDLIVSRENQ